MNAKDAYTLLEMLMDGVNPITGELLPEDHVCHEPAVLRALHKALVALQECESNMQITPPETEQVSQKPERKKALAAESFHVDGDTVAWLHGGYSSTDFFDNANHLMADRDAGHSTWHRAMLDMQIAGADACKGNAHDGVAVILQGGLGLLLQSKMTMGNVGVC